MVNDRIKELEAEVARYKEMYESVAVLFGIQHDT